MKTKQFIVDAAHNGTRLDVYLLEAGGLALSRRKIRQVIDVGGVYVNKKRIRVASRAVQHGDHVRVEYSEAALKQLKGAAVAFRPDDLLLDQDGLFAVNKPPGMPSQATRDQSIMHVVPCLVALMKEQGRTPAAPLVLVHRLDKETSGVLLVAANNNVATWLTEQFRERHVKKTYLAVCYNIPSWQEFTERSALSEIDKRSGDVRPVRAGGRSALTQFRVLARTHEHGVCLIECRPETGRSHQIRVHLAMNGFPIVGDKRYGTGHRRELGPALAELSALHHLLHAYHLEFQPLPNAPRLKLSAPLPERFKAFLTGSGLSL